MRFPGGGYELGQPGARVLTGGTRLGRPGLRLAEWPR